MIEFRNGRHHGRGIVLDQPRNGVIGIIECAKSGCAWRMVLTVEDGHGDENKLAAAVDRFMGTHACGKEPAS